jgi:uncharacterized double-CXXCG motif protein
VGVEVEQMRLYTVKPDDLNWGKRYKYDINAAHKWGLPGVRCPVCGSTWSTTGVEYPVVNLSSLPTAERYRNRWPVSLEEFDDLRVPIASQLSPQALLPPGADFGPLVGRASGKFGDFAWTTPWTMLLRREIYVEIVSYGVKLPKDVVVPELKFKSESIPDLVELQIEPLANLIPASFSDEGSVCTACGRDSRKVERFIMDGASVPTHVDLFRTRDHPTHIITIERFVEAVRSQ